MSNRRDIYERRPAGMDNYLSSYGWHFSKAMCEWAVSLMRGRNGEKITPMPKQEVEALLQRHGVECNAKGYDAVYVYAMAKADYWGSSITTEQQLAKFIGDYLNDKDAYEGMPFTRFYADTIGNDTPILWEEMM